MNPEPPATSPTPSTLVAGADPREVDREEGMPIRDPEASIHRSSRIARERAGDAADPNAGIRRASLIAREHAGDAADPDAAIRRASLIAREHDGDEADPDASIRRESPVARERDGDEADPDTAIRRASLIARERDGDGADPDAAIRRTSSSASQRVEGATGDADRAMEVDPKRLAEAAARWAVTHRVEAGGWRMRYREAGEGPPLVLVHGLGCSTDYWVRNGAWLAAAGFRVLAPDLPGFGRTEGPRAGLSIPKQAYAVSAFAAALGLDRAAYLGHSLSCQTVLELACTEPGRVDAIVLAAPTGDRRKKRLVREAVGFLRDIPREPPSLVPLVADAYLRAGPWRWMRTWLAGKRHDAFAAAEGVRAPAAVLVGERDPVVSVHFGRAIADAIPGARLVTIPGAAHALIYDEPAGFNAAVVAFLASVLDGGT